MLSFPIFLSFPSFPFPLRSAVAVVVANNNNDQSQRRPVSAQCLHFSRSCWCVISVGGGRPFLIVEFVDDQKWERERERIRWAAFSPFSFLLSRPHPLLLLLPPNAQPYRHRYILSHYWHTLLQQQQLTVAVVCLFLFLFLLGLFLCCWWPHPMAVVPRPRHTQSVFTTLSWFLLLLL